MITKKRNILLAILCAVFCASVALFITGITSKPAMAGEGAYKPSSNLVLTEYNVQNYNAQVKIYDPNGKEIFPDQRGNIRLLVVGEYKIVYSDGVKTVRAFLQSPKSELALDGELSESYPAGSIITLPKLSVTNHLVEYMTYFVDIATDKDGYLATLNAAIDESLTYSLMKTGSYTFTFYIKNLEGNKEELQKTVTSVNQKGVFFDELPKAVLVGETLSVGYPYGYYNEKAHDVTVTVTLPNTEKRVLSTASFIPELEGDYTVEYASLIEGQTVTATQSFTATIPTADFLFVKGTGENHGLTDMPAYAPNEAKGILLTSSNAGAEFYYRDIVNLSALTKNDNLVEFLAYSNGEKYMKEASVTFTDVYDASKSVKVRFRLTSADSIESSYVTVVCKAGEYGLSNENKDYGMLRSGYGTTAYYTSFRQDQKTAERWRSEYYFNLQYDYAENTLYLITRDNSKPTQPKQVKLLGLNDASSGLPVENLFSGFTTGEVYVKFEFANNSGAGIYLKELAGKTAEELNTQSFASSMIVFEKSLPQMPNGVVGYGYKIPTAKLSPLYTGNGSLSVSVKDGDGENVSITNNAFTPTKAGAYTISYSTTFAGNPVVLDVPVTVNELPTPINVACSALSVGYYEYLAMPDFSVTGGSGELSVSAKFVKGDVEIPRARNGKYLIDAAEQVYLQVTAVDYVGYEKTEKIPVTVTENYTFVYDGEIAMATKAGSTYIAPTFKVVEYENGRVTEYTEGQTLVNGLPLTANEYSVPANDGKTTFELAFTAGGYTDTYTVHAYPSSVNSSVDYFITQNVESAVMTEAGVLMSTSQDAKISLPYKIAADNLLLYFAIYKGEEADKPTFDKLTIKLTDHKSSDLYILLEFSDYDKADDTVALSVNGGKKSTLSGQARTYSDNVEENKEYAGKDFTYFSLALDGRNGLVRNNLLKVSIAQITQYVSGAEFDGFDNYACFMDISVDKSENSKLGLILSQISNQYFNYNNDISGYTDSDSVGPAIAIKGVNDGAVAKINEVFTIPAAVAYDVLSGYAEISVTVKIKGKTVLNNASCEQDRQITLDQYGAYSLIYNAYDYNGNLTTKTVSVTVVDKVMPTLTVSGEYNAKTGVGSELEILGYEANDGQGEVTSQVFVKDASLKITFVEVGSKYKFTKAGTYEIVYRAVDEACNVTRKAFTITVE